MIAAVLGWALLLGAAGVIAVAVGRRASAQGILIPLGVAFGVRLAVMLIAHAGSLSLGDDGFFFLDDDTYLAGGSELAHRWRQGQVPDPSGFDVTGTLQFGYHAFVGTLFTLGTTSVLLGKLANVLLGTATVYVLARIAGVVLGERAQYRAAWLAALAPGLVWWSAPLMKEALATLLLALGVLAVVSLPRRGAVVMLGAVLSALVLVRVPSALALIVGGAAAVAVAGRQAEGRWLSRPLVVLGTSVLGGLTAVALILSRGNLHAFVLQYWSTAERMFGVYQGSNLARWPYDVAKSLVTPVPWAFDSGTRNWDRALYPGVWMLFCLYPLAALGIRRLWGRPELVGLVATIGTAVAVNSLTSGFTFRQRSVIEPFVLLLALAGARSWRVALQAASAALAVTAPVAGVQSGSPILAGSILACAGAVLVAARRLPDRPAEPLPPSPMVAGFRAVAVPGSARATGAASVAESLAWLARTLAVGAAAGLRVVKRAAPPVQAPGTYGREVAAAAPLRALEGYAPALMPSGDRGPAVAAAARRRALGRSAPVAVAAALAVTAPVAGVQSGSPILAGAILACAGAVLVAARRLPDRPADPLPGSARASSAAGVARDLAWLARTLAAWLARTLAAGAAAGLRVVTRAAPPVLAPGTYGREGAAAARRRALGGSAPPLPPGRDHGPGVAAAVPLRVLVRSAPPLTPGRDHGPGVAAAVPLRVLVRSAPPLTPGGADEK